MATELVVPDYDDPPVTKAEIEEAIRYHRGHLAKMPAHWVDRRASVHDTINRLLYQWEQAPH